MAPRRILKRKKIEEDESSSASDNESNNTSSEETIVTERKRPVRTTTSKFFTKTNTTSSSASATSSSNEPSASTTSKKRKQSNNTNNEDSSDFELIEFSEDDSSGDEEIDEKKSSSKQKKNTTTKKKVPPKKSKTTTATTTKRKKASSKTRSSSSESEEEDDKKKKKPKKEKPVVKKITAKEKEEMNKIWSRIGTPKKLFIGCHVSYGSHGIEHAPQAAVENGCVGAFALFLGNQKTYSQKVYTDKMISAFIENCKKFNYDRNYLLPHGSYLINLANPDKEKLEKSKTLFLSEYGKCKALGLTRYNFHPGSTVGSSFSVEDGCKQIAEIINWANEQVEDVCSVLECTAGSGHTIGHKFEHLKMIIDNVEDKSRVGVCLDTCHMFAAGYDLRTLKGCEKVFKEFDEIVGFNYLKGMHLNDSKEKLLSKKDRHENIGKGEIGLEVFKYIVNNTNFRDIPLILETPDGFFVEEIKRLYGMYEEVDDLKLEEKEVAQTEEETK